MTLVKIGKRIVNLDQMTDAHLYTFRDGSTLTISFSNETFSNEEESTNYLEFRDDDATAGWALLNGLVQHSAGTTES